MVVAEFYQNMHDVRLKPRLLRSLMKDHLPDEDHPFPSPSELSNVVTTIKTHGLLSESVFGDSVDQKLIDKWKSAVDAWVDRLLLLISSKMPDKCWAGTCLLGVTFEECSNARFLASYSTWFSKLLPQIQQPSESQLVKVASCASLSDMLTRLSGILIVKKDGVSLAGKLIEPIINLLNEDGSESVWDGAVNLFCKLMNLFPSSVHRHYDSVEAAIVSKIMSGKCNFNLSKSINLCDCLALLPKSRGDEDSWVLMMQKILIFINMQLNEAFQFLKEETRSREVMEFLVPPGKKLPPPLVTQESGEASDHSVQRSEQLLFYRVSTLMQCCSKMLTNPYPVQVSVPVRPLLVLVRRVLLVDGSSQQALLPFMTVTQQEHICSELPRLHLYSLELLTAVIKRMRSQLLPNAAEVVRIVTEYFRRCMLPTLRIKVYSLVKILLSMGGGVAVYLAQEVINHAFVDLDFYNHGSTTSLNTYSKHATYALQQPSNTKRKHAALTGDASDRQNGLGVEPRSKPAPISVQIAALQALDALLTVGGALKSESWRSKVDFLLINIASNTCEGGWANEERTGSIISDEFSSTWADFQLAALRALLTSLLSPARCRTQYLGRSLDLFRRGKQETGTKLAEFCAQALLFLEVLIHPRALPLSNLSLDNCNGFDEVLNPKFPGNPFSSALEQNTPFSRGVLAIDEPDPDDDLYKSWLGNGEEVAAPLSNIDENMEQPDKPSNADPLTEKLAYDGSAGTLLLDEGRCNESTGNMNVEIGRYADEVIVSKERSQVPFAFSMVGTSDKGVMIPCDQSGSSAIQSITSLKGRNALEDSNDSAIPPRSEDSAFSKGTISVIDDLPPPLVASSTSLLGKDKQSMSGNDSDDSIPDIIDADPDSDSD